IGIAHQRPVPNRRHKGVLGALDDLKPDCAATKAGTQEILQVSQNGLEHRFEIVVVVGGIGVCASACCCERCKLACKGGKEREQSLRMGVTGAPKVEQNRNRAVEKLEYEVVDAL